MNPATWSALFVSFVFKLYQVMDEGAVLSKKQLELETALKKRKGQVRYSMMR